MAPLSFVFPDNFSILFNFVNELKLISSYLKGKATLNNMDGFINFKCEMNNLGQITCSGKTCYPARYGTVLDFEFESSPVIFKKVNKRVYMFSL
jgi:hypothetical protein